MDINKWKSVAVKKETDYVVFQAKKAKKPIESFKKELLQKTNGSK